MIILTTTFNCQEYVERSLASIMSQTFKDFTCYITDDMSTDNTREVVKKFIKDDPRFILIENQQKFYQPGNYDQIIRWRNIDGEEICVEVDGDDWLPHSGVLEKINEVYKDPNVWMTSGSFKYHNGNPGFASPPTSMDKVRSGAFTLSHLRTWKAWLWKKIDEKDLRDENDWYYEVAGDLAFMYPMVEMCGLEHFKFIPDHLYVYNGANPINDHKVSFEKVQRVVNIFRAKQPYKKL
jgi:glycosyltransferase involved in cell wall biosynthesis